MRRVAVCRWYCTSGPEEIERIINSRIAELEAKGGNVVNTRIYSSEGRVFYVIELEFPDKSEK